MLLFCQNKLMNSVETGPKHIFYVEIKIKMKNNSVQDLGGNPYLAICRENDGDLY